MDIEYLSIEDFNRNYTTDELKTTSQLWGYCKIDDDNVVSMISQYRVGEYIRLFSPSYARRVRDELEKKYLGEFIDEDDVNEKEYRKALNDFYKAVDSSTDTLENQFYDSWKRYYTINEKEKTDEDGYLIDSQWAEMLIKDSKEKLIKYRNTNEARKFTIRGLNELVLKNADSLTQHSKSFIEKLQNNYDEVSRLIRLYEESIFNLRNQRYFKPSEKSHLEDQFEKIFCAIENYEQNECGV